MDWIHVNEIVTYYIIISSALYNNAKLMIPAHEHNDDFILFSIQARVKVVVLE